MTTLERGKYAVITCCPYAAILFLASTMKVGIVYKWQLRSDTVFSISRLYTGYPNSFKYAFPKSQVPNKISVCYLSSSFYKTHSTKDKKQHGCHSILSGQTLHKVNNIYCNRQKKINYKNCQQTGLCYKSAQKTRVFEVLCILHSQKGFSEAKAVCSSQWF
jgi:hypothetical protein